MLYNSKKSISTENYIPFQTAHLKRAASRVEPATAWRMIERPGTDHHMAKRACWWMGTKRSWPCCRAEWNYFLCRDVTWSESGRSWLNSILFPSGSLMK